MIPTLKNQIISSIIENVYIDNQLDEKNQQKLEKFKQLPDDLKETFVLKILENKKPNWRVLKYLSNSNISFMPSIGSFTKDPKKAIEVANLFLTYFPNIKCLDFSTLSIGSYNPSIKKRKLNEQETSLATLNDLNLIQLEELNLRDCEALLQEAFDQLKNKCPNLKKLDVTGTQIDNLYHFRKMYS